METCRIESFALSADWGDSLCDSSTIFRLLEYLRKLRETYSLTTTLFLIVSFRVFPVYPATMTLPAVSLGDSSSLTASVASHTPMANLMSITETLPPGSPRNGSPPTGPQPPRTSSRGSQNSPSSGSIDDYSQQDKRFTKSIALGSSSGRRSSGSRHVSSTTVTSTEAQSQSNNNNNNNPLNNVSVAPGNVNNSTSTVNGQSVDANSVPATLAAPPVNPTLKCKSKLLFYLSKRY